MPAVGAVAEDLDSVMADPYGWDERGPNMARLRTSRSGRSQFSEDDGLQLRFGNLQGFANALA